MSKEKTRKRKPSLEHFKKAVENIEQFAKQNTSSLNKTTAFFKALFKRSKTERSFQKELFESIQFLKTHYRIFHKLKCGSEEEQELARSASHAILSYNTLMHQSKRKSLKKRVANFLGFGLIDKELLQNTIEIPHEARMHLETHGKVTKQKITNLLPQLVKPLVPEIELLRMKSLSIANTSPKMPDSLKKTLSSHIWKAPIVATCEKEDQNLTIVKLEQIFKTFPGEEIVVKGSFKRDENSLIATVAIPDSFSLTTHAYQTGFPDPSQHTGVALSDHLIPTLPLRLDKLSLFKEVFKLKQEIAKALLPSGEYNEKAKRHLKLKSEAFIKYRDELLQYHKNFFHAFLKSAKEERLHSVDAFLGSIHLSEFPQEELSKTFSILSERFIKLPFEKLQFLAIDEPLDALMEKDAKEKFLFARVTLEKELEKCVSSTQEMEKWRFDFIHTLGAHIGKAASSITLQQFSEKVGFSPPLLSDFEQKVHTWAFMQLLSFYEELKNPEFKSPEEAFEAMISEIKKETNLFNLESIELLNDPSAFLVQELELYYNSQYYQ